MELGGGGGERWEEEGEGGGERYDGRRRVKGEEKGGRRRGKGEEKGGRRRGKGEEKGMMEGSSEGQEEVKGASDTSPLHELTSNHSIDTQH